LPRFRGANAAAIDKIISKIDMQDIATQHLTLKTGKTQTTTESSLIRLVTAYNTAVFLRK
jgi:hypothetical protein